MVPKLSRRAYLSSIAVASVTAVAGCTGGDDDNSTDGSTDPTSTPTGETTPTPSGSEAAGSPEATAREYLRTISEDPLAMRDYVHPVHPFHPDNLSEEKAEKLISADETISDVETTTTDESVTAEMVLAAPLYKFNEVGQETVADALEGEETAVVESTITTDAGVEKEYRLLTATTDGEWKILAQRRQERTDESSLEARVVEDVTYDADENRVRVHILESPTADSVTVETTNARSSRSSDTPGVLDYLDVYPDEAGDEVVVTATVDGRSRPVHRERVPPSEGMVEDVTFETDRDESKLYDVVGKVTFTDNVTGEELEVTSTVEGAETSTTSAESVTFINVGLDPDGDEVVVRLKQDGTWSVIHRERYHP